MVLKAAVIWVAGLTTFVPYTVYYLVTQAGRDQYALLITSIRSGHRVAETQSIRLNLCASVSL